jgi:hypothetical protein
MIRRYWPDEMEADLAVHFIGMTIGIISAPALLVVAAGGSLFCSRLQPRVNGDADLLCRLTISDAPPTGATFYAASIMPRFS